MGDKPFTTFDHVLGDEGKARLVGRPGITQTKARAEHDERNQQEQPEFAALARRS